MKPTQGREIYLTRRIESVTEILDKLYETLAAFADGERVHSYTIGSRTVTHYDFDLDKVSGQIKEYEKTLKYLQAELEGRSKRKSVRILLRDV